MRRISHLIPLLALCLMISTGCSDDSPTESSSLTLSDLVGSWKATSMVFTRDSDGQSFDLVANGGEFRTTILASGGARTWVNLGDFSDEWDAQLSLDGDEVTSDPVEVGRVTSVLTAELNGNVLTLTDPGAEFDFTLSGATPQPATAVITLQRQ